MLVVRLQELIIEARHGIHPREREQAQRFVFNIELTLGSERSTTSDDLADTLDYSALRRLVTQTAQNNSYNLIERLAQEVADRILDDKRVQKVTVAIDKPDVYDNGRPGVTLEVSQRG